MVKVIKVDEDIVNDIQMKDADAGVSRDVIAQLLEMHKFDTDASFVNSPLFQALKKESVDKQILFEKAKDNMITKFMPANLKNKVQSWDLNYFTNELTLVTA